MRHSLRPALSLCQKNLYMLLHCPIGGTPDGCISASSYIKDRDWTRPSSSKFLLLTIGRALLRAFPICSQLDASSFEHFPLACNSWHPIAFFSVWILLRRAGGRFAIQSAHFHKLIELRTAQLQQCCGLHPIAAAV